ncbi:hypothetical protein B0H15DRAFT_912554 [Mycena belliarum]|uniref:Transposase n=1 Tax=Mycena belliarum TaxID=1033014 RepID=A0AAD6XKV2_9AGAR|nr:hypothetical protein B0H15DRAFT_912554 [Mycena belliae]
MTKTILRQRFCQSASPAELFEVLVGIKKRCEELGIVLPEMIVVDNCCQVEKEIHKALPGIQICLDIYHFMMRYLAVVIGGMNNPHRGELAAAIRNAVLKNSASKGVIAQYWDKDDQKANMIAVYNKYCERGGVWSAAAHAVHTAQLKHLDRGCLSRRNQEVASDGSRIEGSHKGWNSLQRAAASGLELHNALSHDFVLRRNIRIVFGKKPGNNSNMDPFVRSAFGSHHSRLVNHTASILNSILRTEAVKRNTVVPAQSLRPVLKDILSGEAFGLVTSQYNDTFGGLLTIKSENTDDSDQLLTQVLEAPINPQDVLGDLNIDPVLLFQELQVTTIVSRSLPESHPRPPIPAAKRKEPDTPTFPENLSQTELDLELVPVPHVKKQRLEVSSKVTVCIRFEVLTDMHSLKETVTKPLHPFFNLDPMQSTSASELNQTKAVTPTDSPEISGLTELLPLPDPAQPNSLTPRLTRSQRLFSVLTGTNPKALEISRGHEFFLFVDMREELQWKTSDMTSKKWAEATVSYNERLGVSGVAKRPRALSDKLAELERAILSRLITNTFKSQRGDETFWRKHCFSVPLIKIEANDKNTEELEKEKSNAARAVATCKRCSKIMYPGPAKSPENHKKGYCSDGFKQKVVEAESAPWPQPAGVFTSGSEFHPLVFLATIREVYEKVAVEADSNLTLEHDAFLLMLQKPGRIFKSSTGVVLFKLFTGYDVPAADTTPSGLFTKLDGHEYLRIDALRDSDLSNPSSSGIQ